MTSRSTADRPVPAPVVALAVALGVLLAAVAFAGNTGRRLAPGCRQSQDALGTTTRCVSVSVKALP